MSLRCLYSNFGVQGSANASGTLQVNEHILVGVDHNDVIKAAAIIVAEALVYQHFVGHRHMSVVLENRGGICVRAEIREAVHSVYYNERTRCVRSIKDSMQ